MTKHLVGNLKPRKVSKKKVTAQIPGAPLSGDSNFGNNGTNDTKKTRIKMDY